MQPTTITPENARQMLVEGNRRFASGLGTHPRQSTSRRMEVVNGQHPFAVVLTCADSRVPPEVFFDQGIGDLFVIRNAGNLVDEVVLGSIEYAVEHLGAPLVVVVGHTKCGAVTAAVQGGEAPGHIGSIVSAIRPAVEATRGQPGEALVNATLANVRNMVAAIQASQPILAEAVRHNHIQAAGALYHLESGKVEFL